VRGGGVGGWCARGVWAAGVVLSSGIFRSCVSLMVLAYCSISGFDLMTLVCWLSFLS